MVRDLSKMIVRKGHACGGFVHIGLIKKTLKSTFNIPTKDGTWKDIKAANYDKTISIIKAYTGH